MGAAHAEIEHLLKESYIRNPFYCFGKQFNVIVLVALYVRGAEVFARISCVTFI